MRKATLIGLFGLLFIVLPYLGIPEIWKEYAISGIGVLLVVLSYLQVRDRIHDESDMGNGERGNDQFVETTESLFK